MFREMSRKLQQRENEIVLRPHHVRRASVMHLKVMRGVGEGRGARGRREALGRRKPLPPAIPQNFSGRIESSTRWSRVLTGLISNLNT